jgi:RNA polymerase sigma-70 factor (ECF subfamily)
MVAGDVFAFRKLYEFYQGRIFAYAYSYTKSRYMAEEAVQELFITLWERREAILPDKHFEHYIKVAVRNKVLNMLRRVARDEKLLEKVHSGIKELKNQQFDLLLEKELKRLRDLAILSLPPQQQAVYHLSREEELTYEQIAEKLGISKATVKRHMHEAIKNVRDHVSRNSGPAFLILAVISCLK